MVSVSIEDQLGDLIDKKLNFPILYVDNPWRFEAYSKKGEEKAPQKHYSTMTIEELKRLPVGQVAAKDALLFTWVYQPLLPEAIEVMNAWGFDYKTIGFVWRKLTKHGKEHMSTGYYTRAGMEMVLIGRRGNPPRPLNRGVRQVFSAPIRAHSQKPEEVYGFIESMYDGPYLELFARNTPRPNWTKLGNELEKLS